MGLGESDGNKGGVLFFVCVVCCFARHRYGSRQKRVTMVNRNEKWWCGS